MAGRDLDRGRFLIPDPITITLTRPASYAGGAAASITVGRVQEQAATQEDVESPLGGSLDGTRRTFHLWAAECGAMIPYDDYEIRKGNGEVFVIKRVETLAHGRRFRCHCLARQGTVGVS